jgi:hypothetical protein
MNARSARSFSACFASIRWVTAPYSIRDALDILAPPVQLERSVQDVDLRPRRHIAVRRTDCELHAVLSDDAVEHHEARDLLLRHAVHLHETQVPCVDDRQCLRPGLADAIGLSCLAGNGRRRRRFRGAGRRAGREVDAPADRGPASWKQILANLGAEPDRVAGERQAAQSVADVLQH